MFWVVAGEMHEHRHRKLSSMYVVYMGIERSTNAKKPAAGVCFTCKHAGEHPC